MPSRRSALASRATRPATSTNGEPRAPRSPAVSALPYPYPPAPGSDRFGRIDVPLNNAAIFYGIENQIFSYAYLRKIFDVNYFGAWLMCRAVFPVMKQQGSGSVMNQSSAAAWMHPDIPFDGDQLPS